MQSRPRSPFFKTRHALACLLFLGTVASFQLTAQEGSSKGKSEKESKPDSHSIPGYQKRIIQGFTVVVSDLTMRHNDDAAFKRSPLDVVEGELKTITSLFPTKAVKLLQSIPIWVEWDEQLRMANGRQGTAVAVYYGGHQVHLLQQGKHPGKAKSVTILSMKNLTEAHQPERNFSGCVLLHEIAHAVHDQLIGFDDLAVQTAFKQAMQRKLYDPEAYASTNEREFFAELSCAYFNQLDYHPRTRADLKKHDPVTFQLMEKVWGKQKEEAAVATTGSASKRVKLEKVDLGKPVSGPELTKELLQGQPTFVVFWNAGSESSLGFLPKMNKWAEELEDFGLLTVAIHLTGRTKHEVAAVAQARGVTAAVTQAPWITDDVIASFNDFPVALVFDEEGENVYQGPAFDAEGPLRRAVAAALIRRSGVVEKVHPVLQTLVDQLQGGKSPSTLLSKIVDQTRSTNAAVADPAKALVRSITEHGRKQFAEILRKDKDDPVAAYLDLERFPTVFNDTTLAADAKAQLNKLKKDKKVQQELLARPTLATARKLGEELGSRPGGFDPKQKSFREDNVRLLLELQTVAAKMNKSWPNTRATEEALRLAAQFGVAVP